MFIIYFSIRYRERWDLAQLGYHIYIYICSRMFSGSRSQFSLPKIPISSSSWWCPNKSWLVYVREKSSHRSKWRMKMGGYPYLWRNGNHGKPLIHDDSSWVFIMVNSDWSWDHGMVNNGMVCTSISTNKPWWIPRFRLIHVYPMNS